VHMLSWPCGTTARPFFMAKICLPNASPRGRPSNLAQVDAHVAAPRSGKFTVFSSRSRSTSVVNSARSTFRYSSSSLAWKSTSLIFCVFDVLAQLLEVAHSTC